MALDYKETIRQIIESISDIDYIKPEDIPNIPLYMDQVTTFMESQLGNTKRHPDDKILTKTMINNYAKNDLIPPPDKKKYSREHILLLIFVYYLKNILSINDIQTLLHPITEKYFNSKNKPSMTDVYDELFSLEKEQVDRLAKDMVRAYQLADATYNEGVFADISEEDREFLHQFVFIGMLAFDVYTKKMIIEHMIDQISENSNDKPKKPR